MPTKTISSGTTEAIVSTTQAEDVECVVVVSQDGAVKYATGQDRASVGRRKPQGWSGSIKTFNEPVYARADGSDVDIEYYTVPGSLVFNDDPSDAGQGNPPNVEHGQDSGSGDTSLNGGTSLQIPSGMVVTVKALAGNGDKVYVGDTDNDVSTSNGFELSAGESVSLQVDDVSAVEFTPNSGTQSVCWIVEQR